MSRVMLVFICIALAVMACGVDNIQPENMRITSALEADCGDYTAATSTFAFGEWASTSEIEMLDVRIKIDLISSQPANQPDTHLVVYSVEVENIGSTVFAFLPSLQIYIAHVGGENGVWAVSGAAMNEAGLTLEDAMLDGAQVRAGQSIHLELAAYTPIGAVNSITFILDPLSDTTTPNSTEWQRLNPINCSEGQIP